jgi:branched-chain amino acid transport system permease protein
MTTATAAPARLGVFGDTEPRTVAFWGVIGAVVAAFVAAIGMFEVFNARKVIDPYLSLGYAALMWIPILFGYKVSKRPVLEGIEPVPPGLHNVVAGALTGLASGAGLGLFMLFVDAFEVRGILVNATPRLVEALGFGRPAAMGAAIMTVAGLALGTLGGALHLIAPRVRKALGTAVLWVFLFAFLELVVGNILREAGAAAVDRLIYRPSRGLTVIAAVVVFAAAFLVQLRFAGRVRGLSNRVQTMPSPQKRRAAFLLGIAMVALGVYLPELFGTFFNEILSNVGLFILLALGLNIVVGYAGLLDLGYVAFFAVGAYTTAVVTSPRSPKITPEMAFFEAVPWILLMAAIAGLIIGTPVIRMRGDYLAIVTLGFGEIARIALLSDWLENVFGAAQGILRISPLVPGGAMSGIRFYFGYALAAAGIVAVIIGFLHWRDAKRVERGDVAPVPGHEPNPTRAMTILVLGAIAAVVGVVFPTFATWTITGIDPPAMFRIILVFIALAAFVSWSLQGSRVGRAWMAVREDEQIAQTMGINIVTTKLLAFVMGAMLASFGGALFAVKLGTIFPHSFDIVQSIIILVIVIVGGMGSIKGVVVGAIVLIGILGGPTQPGLLREFGEFKLLLYGAILVWMMLQRPEGLWPSARRAQELHQEEMLQDAWLRAQQGRTEPGREEEPA